jgi:hypothetical protein
MISSRLSIRLERRFQDHAREAHSADRRPEQFRVAIGADVDHSRVGQHQTNPCHMVPERAVTVVVLAVDVARYRAADGHEPRAGRYRHEPPAGHDDVEQVVEAEARRRGHRAGPVVDAHRVVGWLQTKHVAAAVLRGISVGAAQPTRDAASVGQVLDRRR